MGERGTPAPRRRVPIAVVPVAIFALMAMLFAFALGKGDSSRLPSALIGKAAPVMQLAPVDGLSDGVRPVPGIAPADLAKGDVVVVNFWASWCPPCIDEHPLLVELASETKVRMLGINHKDTAAGARRFLGRYGNPFAGVGTDPDGRFAIEWGVYGMPETFIVDGKGRVVYKHVGPITRQSLREKIIPAIEVARRAGS
ncbi:MAG TPA: DsbE family thiol:disulfide interchange protein [Hyphomicrobiaceae bacterium]|nr:DsbE family thiol:disulfide interchange protein [Hyphomicrobiaceae bacterium]